MGATVYTTAGGRRFHFDRTCRALESGRNTTAWLAYADGRSAGVEVLHPVRTRSNLAAALLGYTACRVCVPAQFALPAIGETFGHQPVTETGYYGPELVCARCNMARLPMLSQPWPCTSAVVLGLVERGDA